MEFVTFDNYLKHSREEAYNIFQDEKNLKTFRGLLRGLIFVFLLVTSLMMFGDGFTFNIAIAISILNLLFISFLRLFYKKIFNLQNVRKYIYIFAVIQLVVLLTLAFAGMDTAEQENARIIGPVSPPQADTLQLDSNRTINLSTGDSDTFQSVIFFFCLGIIFFRLSRNELIQLFLLGTALPLLLELLVNGGLESGYTPFVIMAAIFFTIAFTSERKRQKQFNSQYDFYYSKNYESMRMKRELDSARQIQLSMLPDREAKLGDIEICGISLPASEVGGDYFDYFKITDTKTGIFICDVSGHGVASALLLSGLRSCMHLILEDTTDPQQVMEKLNRMVRKTQNRKMFVTAIFAIIDTEKNTCELFNAGHLSPYKISGSSGEIFKIKQHGITLGAIEKIASENNNSRVVIEFNKNDKLILYTDGVNEAMDSTRLEYGFERMEHLINNNSDKKPQEILHTLVEDIKKFVKGTSQRDDITILTIGRV